jgi:hypothetical protein
VGPLGALWAGETLSIATYWRADGRQVPDLRLFVHLARNPFTPPSLQSDDLALEAAGLRDRDVFIQVFTLRLPPDFPPGTYYLSIGAYSQRSGVRLPVYDGDEVRGDRLFLDQITVVN